MFDPLDGVILILTGRRAAGKTTLLTELLRELPGSAKIITYTTRPPEVRDGKQEVNGKDYHFVTKEVFRQLVRRRKLFEWSKRGKHYYGSSKGDIENQLRRHRVVLAAVDPNGAINYKKKFGHRAIVVALHASPQELRRRLEQRALSQKEIDKILADGKMDDKKWLNTEAFLGKEAVTKKETPLKGKASARKSSLSKGNLVDFPVHNENGNVGVVAMHIVRVVQTHPSFPRTVQ